MTHKYSSDQVECAVDHYINLNKLPFSILSTEPAKGRPRVWAVRVTNGTNSANLHWLENPGPADTVKGEIYRDGVHLGHY
jgi:hypothetical protein